MKKHEFGDIIQLIVAAELNHFITTTELDYFWRKYEEVVSLLGKKDYVNRILSLIKDEVDILWFRNYLANQGVEMTPVQTAVYLEVIELALIEEGIIG